MIQHHQWCTDVEKIIEGSCQQCERLNRQYPIQGHLDYSVMFEPAEIPAEPASSGE